MDNNKKDGEFKKNTSHPHPENSHSDAKKGGKEHAEAKDSNDIKGEKLVESKEAIEKLQEEVASLKKQNAELNNKVLLTLADTENLKKRLQKDKEEAISFANKSLVLDILPAIDGLDAAISSTTNEDIRKGIEMARDSFLTILKKWGLEVIDDKGKEYDPNRHEACLFETSSEAKTDTVQETLQRGYALHSRVVRPSKVKVLKCE